MVWHHSEEELQLVGQKLIEILSDYYSEPDKIPTLNYMSKNEILDKFPMDQPPEGGRHLVDVLEEFKTQILPASVKTWHPLFLNQMFAGASFPSIIGDLMASMMNPTLATWEMSPVATLIERASSQWMAQILGMRPGSSGIFLPGGSVSNLMAMTIARHRMLGPTVREKGLPKDVQPVILCSEASHYSIANAGNILGIGTEYVLKVKTNHRGEMLPEDLKAQLAYADQQGWLPIAVVATLGLTVTGGFDPLSEIIDICKGRNIHIHADAAFGGGMCLTEKGRHLFKGIDQVDSVTWDAHKTMHTPLTCSVLLVPDLNILKATFSHQADYLFHPQESDELDDLGKYTLLCGKRFDALKIWLLWNTYGTSFFRDLAEERDQIAHQLFTYLEADPDFVPAYEPVSPIQCFRFNPPALAECDTVFMDGLHRHVRETLKQSGRAFFNVSKLNDCIHFRMILINPLTTIEHLTELCEDIRQACWAYVRAHQPSLTST
ncbi:MAG: hypothetical protein KDC71_01760 [Acidobacteria bacterium]|nr:hypothetical protein [Acidobacteriota bacterium]